MNRYIAKFWRGNPQSPKGGYETERIIDAKTIASAKKKAREFENTTYGTMTLIDIKKVDLFE